jgi:hypothetical protein
MVAFAGDLNGIADVGKGGIPPGKEDHPAKKQDGESQGAEDEGEAMEKPVEEKEDKKATGDGENGVHPDIFRAVELVVGNGEKDENEKADEPLDIIEGMLLRVRDFLGRIKGMRGCVLSVFGVVVGISAHIFNLAKG